MNSNTVIKCLLGLVLSIICLILAIFPILNLPQSSCAPLPQVAIEETQSLNPPDLQQLAAIAASGGLAAPTPEQIEEERQIQAEQVQVAQEWLTNADTQQRINGAEQLSAYPTPEAENFLVDALQHDVAEEVRAAAAASLGGFATLKPKTIDALVLAMQNANAEVRFNAFNTLQSLVYRANTDAETHKQIINKLKKASQNGMLNYDMRETINDLLMDQ